MLGGSGQRPLPPSRPPPGSHPPRDRALGCSGARKLKDRSAGGRGQPERHPVRAGVWASDSQGLEVGA